MEEWEKWELKYSLAKLIVPRLKAYKEEVDMGNIQSIPIWIDEIDCNIKINVQKEIFSDKEIELINVEWSKILGKMIFAFNSLIDLPDGISFSEIENMQKEGINLFSKYYFNLWD